MTEGFLILGVVAVLIQLHHVEKKLNRLQFWIDLLSSNQGLCSETVEEIKERGVGK